MIYFTTSAELRQAEPPESPCRMSPRQFERRVVALAHALREVCMEVEMPVIHRFAPGIYIREIFMPANSVVIGNLHYTEHFNLVLTGACHVLINGETHDLHAGDTMVSKAGARKMLLIHEDCRWQTIHANPDDCQDIETLEARIVDKSAGNAPDANLLDSFRALAPTFDTLQFDPRKINKQLEETSCHHFG
jgi:quercetin dioxygenase-like cupin family protein